MKNKTLKRLTALFLAGMLTASCAACGSKEADSPADSTIRESSLAETKEDEEADEPSGGEFDWLNTSGTLPIVKEGTEKTLTIAINMSVDSDEPENMWFYKFIEDQMNINLEVIKFTADNASEYLSLTFADNDLPDIIIGASLGATTLMTYVAEGQIADLSPYITEEFMPNLSRIYEEHPEYKDVVTDSEGHVWSLGYINDPTDRGQIPRGFLNYDWLEEANLEVPQTLDEFLDCMRAFKERGDDIIPMGGCYAGTSPTLIILNAFGYNTTSTTGLSICLRNGKVVLPVADREAYGAYLETMKTIYDEGLIHPDFFTMDANTSNAIISSGNVGYIAEAPSIFMSDMSSWWGVKPLTSDYNDSPMWPASSSAISAGKFIVTSSCEDIELACAFADWFFTEEHYELSTSGPASTLTDYLYDLGGFEIDPDTKAITWTDVENNPNLYSSSTDYINKKVALWTFKVLGLGSASGTLAKESLAGWPADQIDDGYPDISTMENPSELRKTITDGDMFFRLALQDTLCPYVETGFPGTVYLDSETATAAANLKTVLQEYAKQETAKFITGARSLDELDAYFTEMEELGAAEYVKIYQDYYDSLNSN